MPLHVAAWKGHSEAAKTLVDLGANINATDEVQHTKPYNINKHHMFRMVTLLYMKLPEFVTVTL